MTYVVAGFAQVLAQTLITYRGGSQRARGRARGHTNYLQMGTDDCWRSK